MVSGATVRHHNPFESLDVFRNDGKLSKDFIEKWVVPYYLQFHGTINQASISSLTNILKEINIDIVKSLLGDFNWRTRLCGAFFAGAKNYHELQYIIGNHLLKSEVCFAGAGYCLALTSFNTTVSKEYLEKYLEYYLSRKDLWFDQADAYCALEYLDKNAVLKFSEKWDDFALNKPDWHLNRSRQYFSDKMEVLKILMTK